MTAGIFLSAILVYAIFGCNAKGQNTPEDETLCSADYTQRCSALHASENYSLSLSGTEYSPQEMISVRVYSNSCPAFSSEGPKWYMLEALQDISNGNKGRLYVGTFLQHFQRSEAQICKHKARVIFSTCEPNALDLPGQYEWSARKIVGTVCFRLTIQANASESCEVTEQCISPSPESSGEEALDSLYSDTGSADYNNYYYYHHNENEDDTDATSEVVNSTVSEDVHIETDEKTFEMKPTCQRDRDNLIQWGHYWKPVCDCSGYYKLIQCTQNPYYNDSDTICWCSTKLGGEIVHSRKKLVCSDPEEFSFFCSET